MLDPRSDPPPPRRWLAVLGILFVLSMFGLSIAYRFTGDFTGFFTFGTSGRRTPSE